MADLKRLDRLEVATTDLADAASIYDRKFGFEVIRSGDGRTATVRVGDSEIRLATGDLIADVVAKSGEGMFALWLEADDVSAVAESLRRAGIEEVPLRREGNRRILAIDPKHANQVPLFIFDRKG